MLSEFKAFIMRGLEVTNSFKNMVPDYYTRKQTLTNAERYIIPELKDLGRSDSGCGGQTLCPGI